jgi:hypothetical protein
MPCGLKTAAVRAMNVTAWLAPLLTLGGCATGGGAGLFKSEVDDDIVAIRSYYDQLPWLKDADKRTVGFRTRAYFVSGRTDKGVFVPGRISATMARLHVRPDGSMQREPIYQWDFDQAQAEGYRVRKSSILGSSYGLVLRWPDTVIVAGRRVEIAITYTRGDGRVVSAPPRQFDVPPNVRALPDLDEPASAPSAAGGSDAGTASPGRPG